MCGWVVARMAQGFLLCNGAIALISRYSHKWQSYPYRMLFEWRDCTTQSIGRDLTIEFGRLLLDVWLGGCPDGTGFPVMQRCNSTDFALLTQMAIVSVSYAV